MSLRALAYLALLSVAGCAPQTSQPTASVQVVSPVPVTSPSSTPLPPSVSPYYNGAFKPFYPQPYFGGPNPAYVGGPNPAYIGGPNPAYVGAPNSAYVGGPNPAYIGGPNPAYVPNAVALPQRFVNGPSPYPVGPFVPILQQTFDITPEGSYAFSYQSADGTQRQESGGLKYPSAPGLLPTLSVQGSYAAITPEGVPIDVTYIADENGYQPSGPGIHPAIQRAVAQQVAQAKQEQTQPGLIK